MDSFFIVDRFFAAIVSMPSKIPRQYYNGFDPCFRAGRISLSHSEFRRNARAQRREYRSDEYYRTSRSFYRVYSKCELKHLVFRTSSRNEDGSAIDSRANGRWMFLNFTLERFSLPRIQIRSQLGSGLLPRNR